MEGKEKKEEKRSQREDDARVEGKARSLESEGGAKAGQPGRPPNFSWARPQSCKAHAGLGPPVTLHLCRTLTVI